MTLLIRSLIIAASFCAACAQSCSTILDCDLGLPTTERVRLLGKQDESAGTELYLQIGSKEPKRLYQDSVVNPIGEIVLATCREKGKNRAMVFAVSDGTPYYKGAVIRYNHFTRKLEKLFFSEKALPSFVYLNQQQMLLVLPNRGVELRGRYIVYRYSASKELNEEPVGQGRLPAGSGYERWPLRAGETTSLE